MLLFQRNNTKTTSPNLSAFVPHVFPLICQVVFQLSQGKSHAPQPVFFLFFSRLFLNLKSAPTTSGL